MHKLKNRHIRIREHNRLYFRIPIENVVVVENPNFPKQKLKPLGSHVDIDNLNAEIIEYFLRQTARIHRRLFTAVTSDDSEYDRKFDREENWI